MDGEKANTWWSGQEPAQNASPISINKPLPSIPPYQSSSFASTSSLAVSMISAGHSASAVTPSPSSGGFGHSLLSFADPQPDRRHSIASQNPTISTIPHAHHSRHASVQSALSRSSSCSSADGGGEEDACHRSTSPVSIATTFGGAPRNNHRSRTTSGERPPSPPHLPHTSSRRSTDSITSEMSSSVGCSTVHPSRRSSFRMSLPPNAFRHAAITPELESDDPLTAMDWSARDVNALRERAAEQEMRSAPGVIGVGEGWAGGPSGQKKKGGWFRRSGRRKGRADTEDPLALWTVPEEPRTSPLKSAWNRSRARFGASVPALGMSSADKVEKGPSLQLGKKARSVFSASRTELRVIPKWESESRLGASPSGSTGPQTSASMPPTNPRFITAIPEHSPKARVQSQPHLPLPRTTSLRHAPMLKGGEIGPGDAGGATLGRVDTFGNGAGRSTEGKPAEAGRPSVDRAQPTLAARRPSQRRSMFSRLKSRLSIISSSARPTPSPDHHPGASKSSSIPNPALAVQHSPPIPPPFPTVHRRPRPTSMIPLSYEPDDSSVPSANPEIPSSNFSKPSSFFGKLNNRRSSSHHDLNTVDEMLEKFEEKPARSAKRKSFSASMRDLTRWSKSEGNLLRYKQTGGSGTLEDLIERLKAIRVPGEEEATGSGSLGGDRAGALAATRSTLNGDKAVTPSRHPPAPASIDSSPPKLGSSSGTTSRSNSTTNNPQTPSLGAPPRPSAENPIVLAAAIDESAPRLPSSHFAWASQAKKWKRRSRGEDSLDGSITRRWLMGSHQRSSGTGKLSQGEGEAGCPDI